jgi:hypothetical protein
MTTYLRFITLFCSIFLLAACSVDKLEARLQAEPQCKSVMNVKTGVLMPCPGTDKAFYKSIPGLQASVVKTPQAGVVQVSVPVECKPQLHQKSGGLIPCPAQ